MDSSEEMLALLRELRDLQRESLELQRERQAIYKDDAQDWREAKKDRAAEYEEFKARAAQQHADHLEWVRVQRAYQRRQRIAGILALVVHLGSADRLW